MEAAEADLVSLLQGDGAEDRGENGHSLYSDRSTYNSVSFLTV